MPEKDTGPKVEVPKPTFTTFIYSLSILRISFGEIEDIPLRENISAVLPIPDGVLRV